MDIGFQFSGPQGRKTVAQAVRPGKRDHQFIEPRQGRQNTVTDLHPICVDACGASDGLERGNTPADAERQQNSKRCDEVLHEAHSLAPRTPVPLFDGAWKTYCERCMAKQSNNESDANAWFDAVYSRGLPAVRKLIAAGSDIECRDRDGRTPLLSACFEGHTEIVSLLLKSGADVNTADKAGWTALHACAQEGHVAIAKLLLKSGAKVDVLDENGNSPLSNAVFNCPGETAADGAMIRLLLAAGAKKNLKNKHGVSPIDLAKDIANFDLMKHFRA